MRPTKAGVRAPAIAVAIVAFVCTAAPSTAAAFSRESKSFDLPASPGRGKGVARCPSDKHVYGGGVRADAGSQFVVASFPIDGKDDGKKPDDGWKAIVDNIATADTARVVAICGGAQPNYVKEALDAEGVSQSGDTLACSDGKVTGGGVDFRPPKLDGLLNSTRALTTSVWEVFVDNYTGGQINAKMHAICKKGPFKLKSLMFPLNPNVTASGFISCDSGQATSGGVYSTGGFAQTSIGTIFPIDGGDGDTSSDDGWQASLANNTGDPKSGFVSVVCG